MNNFYHTEAEHFVLRRWFLFFDEFIFHRLAKSLTFHTIEFMETGLIIV